MLRTWLNTFAHDSKVHVLILLAVLDFIMGVSSAVFRTRSFRLSYVADIMRRDVLGKVVPYFGLYALALVAGGEEAIPGLGFLDWGVVAGAAYVLVIGALIGSILGSIKEIWPELPIPASLSSNEIAASTGSTPQTK